MSSGMPLAWCHSVRKRFMARIASGRSLSPRRHARLVPMSTAVTPPVVALSGPCAGARSEVQTRCAEAERLTQAQVAHEQRLRDVKRQLAEVTAQRDADSRVRDRRSLDDAK